MHALVHSGTVHTPAHAPICMRACTHTHACACTDIHTCARVHACMHACIHKRKHVCAQRTHGGMHTRTRTGAASAHVGVTHWPALQNGFLRLGQPAAQCAETSSGSCILLAKDLMAVVPSAPWYGAFAYVSNQSVQSGFQVEVFLESGLRNSEYN